jgi:hypothetical protein
MQCNFEVNLCRILNIVGIQSMKWWVMKINMVAAVLFLNMAAVTSCKTNKVVLVGHLLLLTNVHAKQPSACASRSS